MTDRRGDSSSITERLTDRISIGVLIRTIPRELVDEVLTETGRREKRSRRLPAHVVVYFVIAMGIFRDGYEEVLRKLVNGLSFLGNWRDTWTLPTTWAISQAGERLKELPMRTLFDRSRCRWLNQVLEVRGCVRGGSWRSMESRSSDPFRKDSDGNGVARGAGGHVDRRDRAVEVVVTT